jgi:hypothetical protein
LRSSTLAMCVLCSRPSLAISMRAVHAWLSAPSVVLLMWSKAARNMYASEPMKVPSVFRPSL